MADERAERDERRGVEARATTLLAGSIAIVGLVLAAIRDFDYPNSWIAVAGIITVLAGILISAILALMSLVSALKVKSVEVGDRPAADADIEEQIEYRKQKVETMDARGREDPPASEGAC